MLYGSSLTSFHHLTLTSVSPTLQCPTVLTMLINLHKNFHKGNLTSIFQCFRILLPSRTFHVGKKYLQASASASACARASACASPTVPSALVNLYKNVLNGNLTSICTLIQNSREQAIEKALMMQASKLTIRLGVV